MKHRITSKIVTYSQLLDEYSLLVSDKSDLDEKRVFIQTISAKLIKIRLDVVMFAKIGNPMVNNDGPGSIKLESSLKNKSYIKRLEVPIFDNKRRSYARFKDDFEKITSEHLDKNIQAIYLRTQSTTGHAKRLIENLEDIGKMWAILDKEYGRPEQLINEVTELSSE